MGQKLGPESPCLSNDKALNSEERVRYSLQAGSLFPSFSLELSSRGPTGGYLKGGHLKIGLRSEFSHDKSNFDALLRAIPQGKCHSNRESAV